MQSSILVSSVFFLCEALDNQSLRWCNTLPSVIASMFWPFSYVHLTVLTSGGYKLSMVPNNTRARARTRVRRYLITLGLGLELWLEGA